MIAHRFGFALPFACLLLVAGSAFGAVPYKYEKALTEKLSETVPGGSFGVPSGLTFDASGNLYVADTAGHLQEGIVDKFDSSNVFQAPQLGVGVLSGKFTDSVAVNNETGNIYVADSNNSEVFVMSQAGAKLSQWTGTNTEAKTVGAGCCLGKGAVDNSSSVSRGHVYVLK